MNGELREKVEYKRQWLGGTTTTKISLSSAGNNAEIAPQQITAFTASLLQQLKTTLPILAQRIGDREFLSNLRGRPAETFSSDTTALRQNQEELAFIKGRLAPMIEEKESADQEADDALPFTVALNTKFEKIVSREILHLSVFTTTGSVASWGDQLALCSLQKAPHLEIDTFRLGFEHFIPSFFGSMLGSIPTIRCRFYLSLNKDSFKLSIEADNKADSIFSAETLYAAIKQAAKTARFATSTAL